MKRRWALFILFLTAPLCFSAAATAASKNLFVIGTASYDSNKDGIKESYNLIYEADQRLVWLDCTRGLYNWPDQVDWVSKLGGEMTVTLHPSYQTNVDWSTGWRLPNAGDNPQSGYSQTASEMGHLYYVSLENAAGGAMTNKHPFVNLQPEFYYWSNTEFSERPITVYYFFFAGGYQFIGAKYCNNFNAMAVRPAEVFGEGIGVKP